MTVGSILGLTVAYFAYRQFYPSLADERSHRPYSPRIRDENPEPILPVHSSSQNQGYDPAGAGNGHDSFELENTTSRSLPQRLSDAWKDNPGGEESGLNRRQSLEGNGASH